MLTTPAEAWNLMKVGADRARETAPAEVFVRRFLLAGRVVEFTFIGLKLCQQISRSLAHLQEPPPELAKFEVVRGNAIEPALRVVLWDEAVAGALRPIGDLREHFERTTDFADGVLAGEAGSEVVGYQSPRSCTLFHPSSNRIVGCVGSAEALSRSEMGKPLQPILFAWYNSCGIQPVHAGLVAHGEDGVLLGGAGGSGKSTTSLLCVQAGFSYLADDYVGLPAADQDGQTAYSFYASLWLEEEHSRRFDGLRASRIAGRPYGNEKVPFGIGDAFPASLAIKCKVRAVVLPRVAHSAQSRLRPATPVEALLKLAPSSVLQLPFIRPDQALKRLADMLRSIPSFWLDLGTDFESIPLRVAEALELAKRLDARKIARSTA